MKKSILFTIACLFAISTISTAQRSVVKLGLGSLAQLDIHAKYEFALDDVQSIQLGVMWDTPESRLRVSDAFQGENPEGDELTLSGFAIIPEYRYYLGKKGVLNSFYVGAYGRYRSRVLKTTSNFNTDYDFEVKGTLRNFGLGIGCGAQWLINDAFSIDWYIAGFGYNQFFARISAEAADIDDLDKLKMDAIDYLNELDVNEAYEAEFEDLKAEVIERIDDADSPRVRTASVPFGLLDIRFGLSLGYAF